MNFVNLKKQLTEKIENAYLLKGKDDFLLLKAYENIQKAVKVEYPELNNIEFKGDYIDFKQVVTCLNTMPAFSNSKIVYVDINIKNNDIKNIKSLENYFEDINPTSILVIVQKEQNKDMQAIEKNFEIVDCDKVDQTVVQKVILNTVNSVNKKITTTAVKLLIDYTLGQLSKINVELDKVISYVGDRETITNQDIEQIVTKSIDFQIFELSENLAKKNIARVYEILNVLKSKKDQIKTLNNMIYKHFRRLLHVALSSMPINELSKCLGVQEFAIKKAKDQTKMFSKQNLKKINDLCISNDVKLKQSEISYENALDLLVLSILHSR